MKVTADIALELAGNTIRLSIVGNNPALTGLQGIGEYLATKVDEQVGQLLGTSEETARANRLADELEQAQDELVELRTKLAREQLHKEKRSVRSQKAVTRDA